MFPPEPTNDPYKLLGNLWLSLQRAGNDTDGGHWNNGATIEPATAGYKATLQFARPMNDDNWEQASKYIKRYARASHWKVHALTRRKTHAEMFIEHAPPDPKKKPHPGRRPASPKTA